MKIMNPMTIAFPSFGTRISPRFDCAQSILIVKIIDGEIVERHKFSSVDLSPLEKVNELVKQGVTIVVCGGIDRLTQRHCHKNDLRVHAWLAGETENILADMLRSGNLVSAFSSSNTGHQWYRT